MYLGKNITVSLGDTGFAELIFDVVDSRVNIFNALTVAELAEALSALESNSSSIKGLLISSAKAGFIAGADITEFALVFAQGEKKIAELLDKSNRNFNRIESLPFPVVVAIKGFALGGGCEITLACDYRIASEDVRIGLPETRLGIIPGWGGTVRLPRIAGIETAVEWIAAAKEHDAKAALKAGVIDGVVSADVLHEAALRTLQHCVDNKLDYLARRKQKNAPLQHNNTELTLAFMTCKSVVAAQAGQHYPAPLAAVKTMEKAAGLERDGALALETSTFIVMAQTPVALSLSSIFVNDQWVSKKAKQLAKTAKKTVTKTAVLGAGIMGGGIAYQSALKNITIKMKDVQQAGLDLGLSEANQLLSKRVERGRLSVTEMGKVLNRIEPCLSYAGFDQMDVIIEA
ncbi:MAG: 3-hydroxyacyl-CoA dehydrogenase/enoyl-CoA hydratase/3-hydroxybutyryl-CoA epimerase, partial [Kiritimatiellia bacterium]